MKSIELQVKQIAHSLAGVVEDVKRLLGGTRPLILRAWAACSTTVTVLVPDGPSDPVKYRDAAHHTTHGTYAEKDISSYVLDMALVSTKHIPGNQA